ncbi:MAG: hypothetical protein J7545_20715 [Roseofilum sp. SBFL]|nr:MULTISPECIES: hypothetical protein [unclassified Roseofilum]MBP0012799.1 hypothetical protein [Roseofilum sp. SID3]MBP0025177.1 hypothetical protein [Roseofilum sp. SID2]MBP0039792.1 hypothetical protein [Roseofilum sp. SID1]MBP0044365.1 hypothetical protein [Roseofilum sp. SBFL]
MGLEQHLFIFYTIRIWYQEFAAPLLELAEEFKIEEIEILLQQYLSQDAI